MEAGDVLFEAGEKGFDFFVVLEGVIEIPAPSGETTTSVTVHEAGEFTGDVDMVGGRSAHVTARGKASGRVLRVPPEILREVIAKMPGLSDVILQAFLTRRAPRPATRTFWRRPSRASSPSATYGRARSSVWPRPSGRDRWRSSWCISFWTVGDEH